MIRSVCCVCGIQYGTKDDGKSSVVDSHGYKDNCMKITVEMTLEEYQRLKDNSERGKHALGELKRIADMFPACDTCKEMRSIALHPLIYGFPLKTEG